MTVASLFTPQQCREFFACLQADNPSPESELEYTTPYELLVAVVLSAQATDASVNRATRELFAHARTPTEMVRLGVDGVAEYIRTIGLYRNKAKNVVALSQQLLDVHGGAVPEERAALEALPGVGRKTANVILNTIFGQPTMAVDTHVFRVSNRTGLAPGEDVREVEDELVRIIPAEFMQNAHHWLILLGRYTCRARDPACWRCKVAHLCQFAEKRSAKVE